MSETKKPAFSAEAKMIWGPHGKKIAPKDFEKCPEAIGPHFSNFETDPAATLESVSKLFQLIEEKKCLGENKNIPHLTYRSARSLIRKQLAVHGRKELREWWGRYEKLTTEFALEKLDIYEDQPLDGFIPYNFFVKGARDYFGIEDEDLEDILFEAAHRMLQVISTAEKENILLCFSAELYPFFEKPKSGRETKIQMDRQDKLSKLILKKLQTIFKDHEIIFEITSDLESQRAGSFITVQYTNDPQANDSKLGETKTRDLPTKDLLGDLLGEGYKNIQHDEKPDIYIHSIYSKLKAEADSKKAGQEFVIRIGESENAAGVKLERWARLIVYITTHELLHSLGIPHLVPPKGRAHLLMDKEIPFDLLSYWKGANDIAKITDAELLRKLLTPKQKAYLKFILKKKAPENKTGHLDLRRKKEPMGCKKINDRCYLRTGTGGPSKEYLDLYKDENNQEVIGFGFVDPQDLYQPPDAKEPSPVQPTTLFAKDKEGRILSLGHFFGRPIRTLHVAYHDSYFTSLPSWGDLLAVYPTGLRGTELALLSNDLFNFLIDKDIPDWQDPITDDDPQLAGILQRLKKIAEGELKPPRVYEEEAKQREYEYQNSGRALATIHFYWRLGSDEAGRILDEPKFQGLLEQYNILRMGRFEQVIEELEKRRKKKPIKLESSQHTPTKQTNGGACRVENFYLDRHEASKCAEELSQNSGQPYTVVDEHQNAGDEMKPVLLTTYYKVIQGTTNQK